MVMIFMMGIALYFLSGLYVWCCWECYDDTIFKTPISKWIGGGGGAEGCVDSVLSYACSCGVRNMLLPVSVDANSQLVAHKPGKRC